jgi:type IV secretion system protein VirB3
MQHEEIRIHPIYSGMTRPPMFLGITLDYLMITTFVTIVAFMLTNTAGFLVLYIPFHLIGCIGCKLDPNFFRVLMKKTICHGVPNKPLWGCQTYEPF